MTIALITFVVTFLAMAAMVYLQMHRANTGKSFVFFRHSHKTDEVIREKVGYVLSLLRSITLAKAGLVFHRVLDKIESGFIKVRDVIVSRVNYLLKKLRAAEGKVRPGSKKASSFLTDIKNDTKGEE